MMVRVQSCMILLLMILAAEEYNYNWSFQAWVAGRMGVFGFLLGGTVAAIYAGMLIVLCLSPSRPPVTRPSAKRRELVVVNPEVGRRSSLSK
jgi:hypothetical protein